MKVIAAILLLLLSYPALAFTSNNVCDVFKRPVQTYHSNDKGSGHLFISLQAQIQGVQPTIDGALTHYPLGFRDINRDGTQINAQSCEYKGAFGECSIDQSLVVERPILPAFEEVGEALYINKYNFDQVTANGKISPMAVSTLQINDVSVTLESGEYWVTNFSLTSAARINIPEGKPVTIHVKNFEMNIAATINNLGLPDNLVIVGHGDTSNILLTSYSAVVALVYGDGDIALNRATLKGAVTARNLSLEGESTVIGESRCLSPQYQLIHNPLNQVADTCSTIPITFKITNDKGELQTDISGDLSVKATNFLSTACWAERNGGECIGPNTTVPLTGGSKRLWLQNKAIGTVNAEATFTSNETGDLTSEQGSYTFTAGGFRFSPSPLKMVAGKPEKLTIEAVYGDCDPTPIPDYEGVKTLKFGNATYIQPSYTGVTPPKTPTVNGKSGEQIIDIQFADGKALNAVNVRYPDAGALSIPIQEMPSSNADNEVDLNTNGEAGAQISSKELRGDAVLHVRPYTMAICNISGSHHPETDNGRLSKAGEAFSASLQPVIWKADDRTDSNAVQIDESFCSRPVTPSFKVSDAPSAKVTFDSLARVTAPSSGNNASLSGFTPKLNTDFADNGVYPFSSLKVDDVGTFKLRSQLVAKYLDMTVNPGERPLGRFYPSHFSVSGSLTSAITASEDSSGDGFTYLNQPFDGQYTVYAMTADNREVKNYHLLGDAYKAEFEDWVINPTSTNPVVGQDLSDRWVRAGKTGWKAGSDGTSQLSLNSERMILEKGNAPERPFDPLHFAVGVSKEDIDKTGFIFCDDVNVPGCETRVSKLNSDDGTTSDGAEFAQGEFMFGRMRMEGFTETQDLSREQTMPVVVEVFDGQRFVTNTRDNASEVSTDIGEKEVLFSSTSEEAHRVQIFLRDSANRTITKKTVKNGRSEFVVKAPVQNGNLNREQFRYWQRLDRAIGSAAPQTWLQHNWQGTQFDDDPSAIGTFGFYRGSDRVIYKGEKNITLTGE